VRRDEWETIADAACRHAGNPNLPVWSAVGSYYSVCVPSVITPLSFKLWQLHQRIGGTQNETYASYHELPAFWVSACSVIDQEIARIDKTRADKAQCEQRRTLQRLGQGKHGNK